MDYPENPFTPGFGEKPAYLAGRQYIIDELKRAFTSERRRPALTSLLLGARGTGKTTILATASDVAQANGWIAVRTTAVPGMLDDIEIQVRRKAGHLIDRDKTGGVRVSSVGIPQVIDVTFDRKPECKTNWRSRMEDILDQLEQLNRPDCSNQPDQHSQPDQPSCPNQDSRRSPTGTGLLIEVDEVHSAHAELRELVAVYQNFVSDNRRVALLMAGLPSHVASITEDRVVSFLRRAKTYRLGRIDDRDIEDALVQTVRYGGREVDRADLEDAVAAIEGFPFMLQLVGFGAWEANPSGRTITRGDLERGIRLGRDEMEARVFEPTYRELSKGDLAFLEAMLPDEGDTRVCDLAERLQRSSSQVAQYRRRLINAGVIGERGRGLVGFDLPFFKEYLRERV